MRVSLAKSNWGRERILEASCKLLKIFGMFSLEKIWRMGGLLLFEGNLCRRTIRSVLYSLRG